MHQIQLGGSAALVTITYPVSGVYKFNASSGTGKTQICNLIKTMRQPDIVAVTLTDFTLSTRDLVLEIAKQARVVLLDRYDMYSDILTPEDVSLVASSGEKVVLVDSKYSGVFPNSASILRGPGGLEVFCDLYL